jgi:hypothetical protein
MPANNLALNEGAARGYQQVLHLSSSVPLSAQQWHHYNSAQ